MKRVLLSFALMKEMGIFHRDIKPHNMVIGNEWNIKIIDFNVSQIRSVDFKTISTMGYISAQGTKGWKAPELIKCAPEERLLHNPEHSDIFSLGLVFLRLISLQELTHLFSRKSTDGLLALVSKLKVSNEIKNILNRMLRCAPGERGTFQILANVIVYEPTDQIPKRT